MKKNSQRSRKFLLTINNPSEHSLEHNQINETMKQINYVYYCMGDEKGETYHTHLFFECENAISFNRVKKLFASAHIDIAHGSAKENRDYILKQGKYLNSEKAETTITDTFEEYGELPLETKEKNQGVISAIKELVKEGKSDTEIIEEYPSALLHTGQIQRYRKLLLKDSCRGKRVEKIVMYIFGNTGTGKTRSVLDLFGDENVYIVTDYTHPFDSYNGEKVILFDEFHSSIPLPNMLRYTDRYAIELPARYENTYANYDTVIIISNISLKDQYLYDSNETFNALLRRITSVFEYQKINSDLPYSLENFNSVEHNVKSFERG